MTIDLKSLSPAQLQALIASAHSHMGQAKASQAQDVRAKIDGLLAKAGLTLDDVYPTRGKGRSKGDKTGKRSSVAPKYRNPEDASQTWSGRGRQPLWMVAALKKRGTTLDSFLIG